MSTPLVSTHRITIEYHDASQSHKMRAYVKVASLTAVPPTLHMRDGSSVINWTDAATGLTAAASAILSNTFSFGGALLEQNIPGTDTWFTIDTFAPGGTGSLGGATLPASQFTLVVRDTENRKIRVVVLDTAKHYTGHSQTGLGIDTDTTAVVHDYDGTDVATASSPYNWQVSRKELFIKAVGSIAGG